MNAIGKKIKAKVIPFEKNILINYNKIGLNEVETIVLIKLFYELDNANKIINLVNLSNSMTIKVKELSTIVLGLVNKGFISIELINNNEEFNLDNTFDKLGSVITLDDDIFSTSDRSIKIFEITSYVEQVFKKNITQSDLLLINKWLDEALDVKNIMDAILDTAKMNKNNLAYTDAILRNKKERAKVEVSESDEEIADLLNGVYVK